MSTDGAAVYDCWRNSGLLRAARTSAVCHGGGGNRTGRHRRAHCKNLFLRNKKGRPLPRDPRAPQGCDLKPGRSARTTAQLCVARAADGHLGLSPAGVAVRPHQRPHAPGARRIDADCGQPIACLPSERQHGTSSRGPTSSVLACAEPGAVCRALTACRHAAQAASSQARGRRISSGAGLRRPRARLTSVRAGFTDLRTTRSCIQCASTFDRADGRPPTSIAKWSDRRGEPVVPLLPMTRPFRRVPALTSKTRVA